MELSSEHVDDFRELFSSRLLALFYLKAIFIVLDVFKIWYIKFFALHKMNLLQTIPQMREPWFDVMCNELEQIQRT